PVGGPGRRRPECRRGRYRPLAVGGPGLVDEARSDLLLGGGAGGLVGLDGGDLLDDRVRQADGRRHLGRSRSRRRGQTGHQADGGNDDCAAPAPADATRTVVDLRHEPAPPFPDLPVAGARASPPCVVTAASSAAYTASHARTGTLRL